MNKNGKIKYKITATVNKHGGAPTTWIHYSDKALTYRECVKMLSVKTVVGKSSSVKVTLSDFLCTKEALPSNSPASCTVRSEAG